VGSGVACLIDRSSRSTTGRISAATRTVGRALGPKPRDNFITGNRLHPAAFEIVIAPVERFPRLHKVAEVFLDDILHKLVGGAASALRGEVFELLFSLGRAALLGNVV
jgi:hypothetical protein